MTIFVFTNHFTATSQTKVNNKITKKDQSKSTIKNARIHKKITRLTVLNKYQSIYSSVRTFSDLKFTPSICLIMSFVMHEEMLHFVCLLFIFFFRTMTARMYISLDKTVVQYVIYLKMTVRLVFIRGVFSVIWRAGVSEKQRRKGSALRV